MSLVQKRDPPGFLQKRDPPGSLKKPESPKRLLQVNNSFDSNQLFESFDNFKMNDKSNNVANQTAQRRNPPSSIAGRNQSEKSMDLSMILSRIEKSPAPKVKQKNQYLGGDKNNKSTNDNPKKMSDCLLF